MNKIKIYVCSTDYDHEIRSVATKVFPSVESLKRNQKCWKQCGIIQLTCTPKTVSNGSLTRKLMRR